MYNLAVFGDPVGSFLSDLVLAFLGHLRFALRQVRIFDLLDRVLLSYLVLGHGTPLDASDGIGRTVLASLDLSLI